MLPVSGDRDQFQISTDGGIEPVRAPDGHTIYYRSLGESEPRLIAAELRISPSLAVTARRPLFRSRTSSVPIRTPITTSRRMERHS
jgi:hypothetical protein